MSSYTESSIVPKDLRNLPQDFPLNENNRIGDLFDLLAWFRGDMRVKQFTGNTVASQTIGNLITVEPPDVSEEWEILLVQVQETAGIDANDIVAYQYQDTIASINIVLEDTAQLSSSVQSILSSSWPNRDNVNHNLYNISSNPLFGLVVRKRDNTTSWQFFNIGVKTTATVGTRQFKANVVYRRRKVG